MPGKCKLTESATENIPPSQRFRGYIASLSRKGMCADSVKIVDKNMVPEGKGEMVR